MTFQSKSTEPKEQCPHEQIVAGSRFVCIREDHSWPHTNHYMLAYKRRKYVEEGKPGVIEPDRHVFVRAEETC